ncbi:MAG: hypothetical protein D6725_12135 [Planctomycetota bacterium]|nr:MAG: hypothetical protein D6725_12135 [Planctomycetota bacterium]
MPIEFDCPQCGARLRVPDAAAGHKSRCPRCGAIVDVPQTDIHETVGSPIGPAESVESAPSADATDTGWPNSATETGGWDAEPSVTQPSPYATSEPMAAAGDAASSAAQAIPTDAEGIARFAWAVCKENLGLLIGAVLIVGLIDTVLQALVERLSVPGPDRGAAAAAALVAWVIEAGLAIGYWRMVLKIVRGEAADLNDLLSGFRRIPVVFVGSLLFGTVIVAGFVVFIVPGVILSLRLWPYHLLLIEGRAGITEAFSVAWEMTAGHWALPILLSVIGFLAVILGLLACGVGLLVAIPYITVMWASAYVGLYDQRDRPQ